MIESAAPVPFFRRFLALALSCAAFALAPFAPAFAATEVAKPGFSTAGNYLAGRHAQAVREIESALAFYSAVLASEPQNPDLIRRAFVLQLGEGRFADALALAGRMAPDEAKRVGYPEYLRAAGAIKRGQFAEAATRLNALGRDSVAGLVVPLLTAWAEAGRGDRTASAQALAPLAAKEGAKGFFDLHGALLADLAGDFKGAEAGLLKIAEAEGAATVRLTVLLGNLHERMGEPAKALALYDAFIARNPDSRLLDDARARAEAAKFKPKPEVGTASEGAAEALLGLAGVFRQQNVRETALLLARLALFLRPDFPSAQVLLADLYENDNRFAAANAVYEAISPMSSLYRATRARIAANFERMERFDEAIQRLESLAKIDAKAPEPLIQLGDTLRGRKKFKEAAEAYDRAIARVPTLERRHWSLLYSRAIAYERSDQWPRAEADFLKALEFEPEQPYVLNYLGYSWIEKRQNLERATDMIRRAVALRPNDGYIVDSLGWVHYQLGDFEAAVRELERAVELRPEDPVINDHLGDAFWRVGRRTEARFQWDRALGLKPEPDAIDAIKKKLHEGLPDVPPALGKG